MEAHEMDLLIAQQRDQITELMTRNGEMREYIAQHTRMDKAVREIEDAAKRCGAVIVSVEYHFALERLANAVLASAGMGMSGSKFAPELLEIEKYKGRRP